MRVKLGFCSAFCSLAQSFCSRRVWLVHAGLLSCLLDTALCVASTADFLDFFLAAAAVASSASSFDAPSALRFLLSFPSFFFFLASTFPSSNPAASAPPTGLTDCGPGPGLNFACRRSLRLVAAPLPAPFIARGMLDDTPAVGCSR